MSDAALAYELSAGIGHNNPPDPLDPVSIRLRLTDAEAPLCKRRDDLMAGVARFQEKHPTILNDDEQARASDFAKQIQQAIKMARDRFKPAKAPYLEGGRIVDAFFKGITDPLEAGLRAVERPMTLYAQEQERIRRAEAERLAAEARERARQLAEEAAEAARAEAEREAARQRAEYVPAPAADMTAATLDDAIAAAGVAAEAVKAAAAKPAEFSRVRGDFGAVSSLRQLVTVELEDINVVPVQFLTFDAAAAKRWAQANPEGSIPGVRITRGTHIQTR